MSTPPNNAKVSLSYWVNNNNKGVRMNNDNSATIGCKNNNDLKVGLKQVSFRGHNSYLLLNKRLYCTIIGPIYFK